MLWRVRLEHSDQDIQHDREQYRDCEREQQATWGTSVDPDATVRERPRARAARAHASSHDPSLVSGKHSRVDVIESSAQRPYAGYATILAAFTGALAATAGVERMRGHDAPERSTLDYVVLCAGSFKAARALSRERVGSVLRQPFVESDARDVPEALNERPAGDGIRRAVGELVTCTRCVGTWAAAGLLASQVVAPRFGRLLTWSLAAGAANDFLQAGFAAMRAGDSGAVPSESFVGAQPDEAVSSWGAPTGFDSGDPR
jgi:hypothetical protein